MVKLERCWPWLERRGLQSGDHSPWHSSLYKRRPSEDFWNEYSDSGVAYPAVANVSACAMAQASRKRGSLVPSISSPGRSDG